MKAFTVAMALSLLFALQSALANEGVVAPAKSNEGMAIAEQILLREDLSEELPAKEEKVNDKKQPKEEEAPASAPLNAAVDGNEGDNKVDSEVVAPEGDAIDSPAKLAQAINGDDESAKAAPGTLEYDMDTVNMLADADAPTAPSFEKAPSEEAVAKR